MMAREDEVAEVTRWAEGFERVKAERLVGRTGSAVVSGNRRAIYN